VKAHREGSGIAPHILDLGTGWKSVVNFTPGRFAPAGRGVEVRLDGHKVGLDFPEKLFLEFVCVL
jgi:hypothetical protein